MAGSRVLKHAVSAASCLQKPRGNPPATQTITTDEVLKSSHYDHTLNYPWASFCECLVKPDLVPIHQKADLNTLRLARIGSHT